ncbi:MAG: TatD family hydrolase [Bacteroidia bacterium]|nr:MAG: TatD family hydrolase [Bacteroidia bacterium]
MFINVFSEDSYQEAGIEVVNIPIASMNKPLLYSTGIHPWYINSQNYEESLEKFFILASEKQCVAIGKTGLDAAFQNNYSEQKKVFIQQIKAANLLKKPLILYAFKSWTDIVEILEKQKNKMPLIIPDEYLPETPDVLSKLKDYYIAFDKSIYLRDSKPVQWIKNISSKRILFYNTDESVSIKDIYTSAAYILNVDIQTLQHQILENFYRAFMIEKLPL